MLAYDNDVGFSGPRPGVVSPAATSSPAISVVVPAYRSTTTLEELTDSVVAAIGAIADDYEIIFVDDGSGGETWTTIEALTVRNPKVKGIRLARNYGQHNALLAGIRASTMPLVVTIDDDLQHPPSEILSLLDALDDDVDLVYGSPVRERQGFARNAASKLTKRAMAAALGPDVYPRSSAFRLFRRELVQAGSGVDNPSISIDVLLSWATTQIRDVPVDHDERRSGTSGYNLRRLIRHAVNMITGYSTRPLQWVSVFGLLCALFGFGLLLYVIIRYLVDASDVAGFTFLAAALTLFSGVQLLSLGVLGEYLGRMHIRSMGRPPYLVRSTAGLLRGDESTPDADDVRPR